jgi:segregation and condensation protein A
MEYTLRLDTFEGPLDLLLHLIEKAELDIHEIPIAEVTDQYLQYLHTMQELQLDIASEFLVMAATLLEIKSNELLPRPIPASYELSFDLDVEEYDPKAELMERILEYKKYKLLAQQLKEREIKRNQIYSKPPEDLSVYAKTADPNPVRNVTIFDLLTAFRKALEQLPEDEPMTEMPRDEISVKDRMLEIRLLLAERNVLRFRDLFSGYRRRSEVVVTFLALLELIKNKHVFCKQQRLFGEIEIHPVSPETAA